MNLIDLPSARTGIVSVLRHGRIALVAAAIYALAYALESLTAFRLAAGEAPLWQWLGAMVIGFVATVPALAAFGRIGLEQAGRLAVGDDERRVLGVMALIWVLLFTVLGTAGLALMFMLTALAVINVDVAAEPPAGMVDIYALFGIGEWIVAGFLLIAFVGFSLWLVARLAVSLPATLHSGRVRVLSIWPVSSKRWIEISLTLLAAAAPGVAILIAFNLTAQALFGVWPGAAHLGAGAGSLAAVTLLGAIHGALKLALVIAPGAVALGALYIKFPSDTTATA
ncbi:hypothetical protein L2D00_04190 [Hyphomonadaceae bacterium BL14]|nr:hypothetical protein L2D00_04190 [Hyphomonadaceae bacterium BL14]